MKLTKLIKYRFRQAHGVDSIEEILRLTDKQILQVIGVGNMFLYRLREFQQTNKTIMENLTKAQAVEFGRYLLSDVRTKRIASNWQEDDNIPLHERLKEVYDADFRNWQDSVDGPNEVIISA